MAYSRTTWATGDIIEAAKLNNIEAGIVANEAAIAAVTGEAIARYGASGYNNSNPKLTRLYDAVGLNAAVGTDSATAVNDFDNLPPFNRKKCVGTWKAGTNKAVFEVAAYADDPDFAEDGSMGDYVAVDCPPAYYKESDDGNTRIVSAVPLAGFQPFKCLENPDAPGTCRQHTYLPAYALALKDGKAVSLPGFANRQGTYAELLANARTYANSEAAAYAMLEPADVNFYEETLYSIEFATHNCQSIMQGCAGLRNSNDDTCTIMERMMVSATLTRITLRRMGMRTTAAVFYPLIQLHSPKPWWRTSVNVITTTALTVSANGSVVCQSAN